jgi:hypothetical protein
VGTADAVRGRVWKIAKDSNLFTTSNNPLGEPVADALEVKKFANSTGERVELMAGWELNDGTVAVGGAAGVKSSIRNFILASTRSDDDQPPLSRFLVNPFVVPTGQLVTLSAQVDSAMMNQSFRINIINVP